MRINDAKAHRARRAIERARTEDPERPDVAGPSEHSILTVKYALIAFYGILSGVVGVTTIDEVLGRAWSIAWPGLLVAAACASIIGVAISARRKSHTMEIYSTMAMILVLVSYPIANVVRTIGDHEWERLPFAVLPIIVTVAPYARLLKIVQKGSAP